MNSNTRLSTRTAALATCLIAFIAGATACGTEDGSATAPAKAKPASSDSFIKSSQAGQSEYLRQLQAKRDAIQAHQYSDDRRHPLQSHKYSDDRRQPYGHPGAP